MFYQCEKCESEYQEQSSLYDLERFENGETTMICKDCLYYEQVPALMEFFTEHGIETEEDYEAETTTYKLASGNLVLDSFQEWSWA